MKVVDALMRSTTRRLTRTYVCSSALSSCDLPWLSEDCLTVVEHIVRGMRGFIMR